MRVYTRTVHSRDAYLAIMRAKLAEHSVPAVNGCLEWIGFRNPHGYGVVSSPSVVGRDRRARLLAHRVAFECANGPIPTGAHVCHRCDNPACVLTDHLFLGDQLINMADCASKGRFAGQRKTHCAHGHPLSGENLWVRQSGSRTWRQCRICHQRHAIDTANRKREAPKCA